MIPPIYPSTTLKTDFKAVKDATQDEYAIVTDGTRGNYVFGTDPCIENPWLDSRFISNSSANATT